MMENPDPIENINAGHPCAFGSASKPAAMRGSSPDKSGILLEDGTGFLLAEDGSYLIQE